MTTHEQASCSFNVDLEMRPIIQAIIDHFPLGMSTHASCQGGGKLHPYILIRCSELGQIDELKKRIFQDLPRVVFEYEGRDFFRIQWHPSATNTIKQRCHGLDMIKEKSGK